MEKSTVPFFDKIFLSRFSFSTLKIDEMIDEKNGKSNLTRANMRKNDIKCENILKLIRFYLTFYGF